MRMTILPIIFFVYSSGGAASQPNSRPVLSSSSLSRMVVSRSTGDVFLADQDTVYLLPGDLGEVTSNVSRTAGQTPEGMTLSKQEDKLIVCWASFMLLAGDSFSDAPCVVYNSTNLQTLQTITSDSIAVGAARGNPYLVSQGFVEDEGETFYVMSVGDSNLYHREYRIPDGARASETPTFIDMDIADRRYLSGATAGNFSYFAVTTIESTNIGGRTAAVRMVRVCNVEPSNVDTVWDSWYEIQVICGATQGSLADFDNELISANFLYPSDGAEEPLLVVSAFTDARLLSFCTVPLSMIDASAGNMSNSCATNDVQLQFPWTNTGPCSSTAGLTECDLLVDLGIVERGPVRLATQPLELASPLPGFGAIMNSQPFLSLSSRASSSEVFVVDGVVVIIVGYSSGQVRKYATRRFSDTNTNPAPERTWSLSSKEVKALSHASGSDFVYALTEDEVRCLPVEECSNFTDCSACITEGGLLCGWCSVENKCSRRPECANSNSSDGLRWVQRTDRCLTVDIASAVSISGEQTAYPRETTSINIIINNLPTPLLSDSELFECVLGTFGSGNLTAQSGNTYRCDVPHIPPFQNEVSQTVNFTLRSSLHGVDFGLVQNGVIFYDCLLSESCSSCTSRFNCNWCPIEFQCRTSGADCSQSPVSTSASCPRLLPDLTSDGRYYLHEGLGPQDESLVLRGENLLMPTAGYFYSCVISSTGSELMATVDANSSVTCQLPNGGITVTELERVTKVELQWRKSNNTFTIETSSMEQLIVLYNCSGLSGDDCSGCLGLSADYNCGYCQPECNLNSLACAGSNLIQAPDFDQCGAFTVAETSPSAGPVAGSTLLTISGTNLGAYPRENISILIGRKECVIDGERTISGTSLVCVVPSAMAVCSAGVTLSRSGESPQNISTFRYAAPVIFSITPNKGTPSGGTAVVISGENLDIGNTERTTGYTVPSVVDLNDLRRNFTSVEILNSSAVSGMTSPLEENEQVTFRFVVVNIDGIDVFGSVLFQYVIPRLTSVPEKLFIKAGGVSVTIIGVDVDAAVQPVITLFNNKSISMGSGNCTVQSLTSISCRVPSLPDDVGVGVQYNFTITFDRYILNSTEEALAQSYLETTGNPTLESFDEIYTFDSGRTITIAGTNLHRVPDSDYSVTVGGQPCTELDVNKAGTAITCLPPQSVSVSGLLDLAVNVYIGDNLMEHVGTLHYDLNIILTGLQDREFSGGRISITGVNLQRVPDSDYSVTVGGQPCTDLNVNDVGTAITCLPPVVAQVNAPTVVHIGTLMTVDVGSLSYAGVIFGSLLSAISLLLVLAAIAFFIVISCKLYKKRLSREKAHNKQLEQEVLNMKSQVTMIHGQMKEMAGGKQPQGSGKIYSEIDDEPYDAVLGADSIVAQQNPAYIPVSRSQPSSSPNPSTNAPIPVSHIYVNEGADNYNITINSRDEEEGTERVKSRMDEEGEDDTYYTPMDGGSREVEEVGKPVPSRAALKEAQKQSKAEEEGTLDWEMIAGATTLGEVDGTSGSNWRESGSGVATETAPHEVIDTETTSL